MGWNERRKRAEMKLRDLKYLVVRERGSRDGEGGGGEKDVSEDEESGEKVEGHEVVVGKKRKRTEDEDKDAEKEAQKTEEKEIAELMGFASFMPTYEDGKKVIYVYEIHLEEELRGFVPIQSIQPHFSTPQLTINPEPN
jgi:hypothetical protein